MGSKLKNIRLALKWTGFFIPFTFYFCLFFIAAYVGYSWLQHKAGIPDSAYRDIFSLLLRFTSGFCLILLSGGLIAVIIPFVFFIIKKRKNGINFSIDTKPATEQSKQPVTLHIDPILKPILGFVKIRLKYDTQNYSEKFSLIKRSQNKLFTTELDGTYYWDLPEIKEYRIEKAVIYFEDFFQFFSFAVSLHTTRGFHTYPVTRESKSIDAFPRKTEETSTRIEEIKKVEGEHINYKNFESNDDVRRIVWKIYAKNKELVVRIPEVLDPYASHMYLYTSFFSSFDVENNEVIRIPFLNYYKTICWSVYNQLVKKGFDVRYIADQDIPKNGIGSNEEQARFAISVSKWHRDKELRDFVKAKDASVVIISSLSDPEQVKQLLESNGRDISFVFVPLTQGLNKQNIGAWLQWLFVQQEKDSIAIYRTSWSLSLLRLKVMKNEKQIKQLLDQYERSTILHQSN
ncbi:MAG: hypothetical protein K0Q95_1264 [Bacteroidota bacterium]|jgi:uncharacterized protein (DUF58 family)|nr:hypothetical protein [Bacteroidota bacterium]